MFQANAFQNNAFQMTIIFEIIPNQYDYMISWQNEILEFTMMADIDTIYELRMMEMRI